jgi:hypothetical protein
VAVLRSSRSSGAQFGPPTGAFGAALPNCREPLGPGTGAVSAIGGAGDEPEIPAELADKL